MADTHPLERILDAWAAPSSAERYRIVSDVTADTFYYADPHSGPLRSRAEFMDFLSTFKTRIPDGAMTVTGPVDQHETHARIEFTLTRGGSAVRQGLYVADLSADNRITRLVGFLA